MQWKFKSPINGIQVAIEFLASGYGFESMQRRPKRARYGGRVAITYCGPRGTCNHKGNENCGSEKALAHSGFVLRKIDLEGQTFRSRNHHDKDALKHAGRDLGSYNRLILSRPLQGLEKGLVFCASYSILHALCKTRA